MPALNFPTSPTLNQVYSANGKTWKWDGTAWKVYNIVGVSGGGTGLTSITYGDAFLSSNSAGTALTYRTLNAGTGMQITISSNDVTFAATGVSSGTVTGTGISGFVPLWTSAGIALTNSIMQQSDTTMIVSGQIKAITKSFKIDHPLDPKHKYLEHGSLEGPEHGAYQRGTAEGYNTVTVKLPDYWEALVEDNYTIHITSRCNHNLYIYSQSPNSFLVRRIGSSFFGKSYILFDYFVIGQRRDMKLDVVQNK
jgi:hypothetical protein